MGAAHLEVDVADQGPQRCEISTWHPAAAARLAISAWHPALAALPRNIRSVTAQVPNKKKKHLGYFDEEIEAAKAGDDYMSFRRVYIP